MRSHIYRRKNICAMLFLTGIFLLAGCGDKDRKEIVLITNGGTVEDASVNQSVWEAVQNYAGKQEKTSAAFQPEEPSTMGFEKAINAALKEGAEVIVCPGEEFEEAVYDMQKEDLSVKYILLGGVPHAKDSTREKLRGNTHAVTFAHEEAGFLAGYAAVKAGYTNLGYLGGKEEEQDKKYASGMIQGANQAAEEMGLSDGQIRIHYQFLGSERITPDVEQTARGWYEAGCQVILGNSSAVLTAAGKAAADAGAFLISIENAPKLYTDRLLAHVEIGYGEAAEKILQTVSEKKFGGGEKEELGVGEGGAFINMEASSLGSFTEADYQKICGELKQETIQVTGEDVAADVEKYGLSKVALEEGEAS